jgi:DNA-binding NarL/FixJ family response regulator
VSNPRLQGFRVLVVEDNFLLALELADRLRQLGAQVLGPYSKLERAQEAAQTESPTHGLLDINLRGVTSFSLAENLLQSGVRLVFVTGYSVIPDCPAHLEKVPRVSKPVDSIELIRALESV